MTVSLLEVLAAARTHAAPLAAESAGYLLLAVTDHVVSAPRVVQADEAELMSDGTVRLRARRGAPAAHDGAEQALRHLLRQALQVSSSVGPALRRAAERRDEAGLSALVRELETALIPVNRGAAKRALSRLHRETERARDAGKLEAALLIAPAAASPPAVSPPAPPAAPEPLSAAADFPESPRVSLPAVTASAPPSPSLRVPQPAVELTLTPAPRIAASEAALTKPEPVVQRARERGSATPRLGTLVTAQTLPGEETERTERVPAAVAAPDDELDLPIVVELEPAGEADDECETPALAFAARAQPLLDPEPSRLPDVLTAMLELHTAVEADQAPTRIRGVVTEPRATPAPQPVDDVGLSSSSLDGVVTSAVRFESERADPALHEAVTWNPGPVAPAAEPEVLSPALLITEPALEPSPYAPAVLPAQNREVSELLESFYVSGAPEERELRSALKEMAGLELTPMPHPYVEEG